MRYINLIGEMAKADVTKDELAKLLDVHWNSIANKLSGRSSFTVDEAIRIRDYYFQNCVIEYLFAREAAT